MENWFFGDIDVLVVFVEFGIKMFSFFLVFIK